MTEYSTFQPAPAGPDYLVHAAWVALAIASYIAAWRAGKLDEYVYLSLGAFFAVAWYWRQILFPDFETLVPKAYVFAWTSPLFPLAFYCAWRRGFAWDFVYSALMMTILPYWSFLTVFLTLSVTGFISHKADSYDLLLLSALILAPAIPVWVAWRWWDYKKVIAQAGAALGAMAFIAVGAFVFTSHPILAVAIYAVLSISALAVMESKAINMLHYFILAFFANAIAVSSMFPLFCDFIMLD